MGPAEHVVQTVGFRVVVDGLPRARESGTSHSCRDASETGELAEPQITVLLPVLEGEAASENPSNWI